MRKTILAVLILILSCTGSAYAYAPKAPNIKGRVLNANVFGYRGIDLNKLEKKGYKAIVVNFWATWCPPCRAELPLLNKSYEVYGKKGILFIGVNVNVTKAGVKSFVKEFGLAYPVIHATYSEIMGYGGINFIPQTFFINNRGRIIFHWKGALNGEILNTVLNKILSMEK
ncbi:MAG: redoxin domain-containing protein [Deltaproteobacteria bacterium]|nr:redoxin domain-containing protein [Deltaproteobacteria bacterium]